MCRCDSVGLLTFEISMLKMEDVKITHIALEINFEITGRNKTISNLKSVSFTVSIIHFSKFMSFSQKFLLEQNISLQMSKY